MISIWGGGKDYLIDQDIIAGSFDVVISSSVLEHLVGEAQIHSFFDLCKKDGIVLLHTLICEEVPNDPEWFYLLPGHCTLWTNAAMAQIYRAYEYVGCAYHEESQMWIFFGDRNKYDKLKSRATSIMGSLNFSDEFLDYWKQKPYRY